MTAYLVAATHDWNIRAFERQARRLPGSWRLISRPEDLEIETIVAGQPRYIFFPHWSWRVPAQIVSRVECVGFHMTDVPYGRGGSPLQNLILRGHSETMLTALRMTEEMDVGPVYLKRPLSLGGRAQEIFERAADLVYEMIAEIITKEPVPIPQEGEVELFRRRRPEESLLPETGGLKLLYDHIRMLDAEGYPHACLEYGDFVLHFTYAEHREGEVTARVHIRQRSRRGGA